jgi:DNA-binding winged helix-turn-helix (wHTH) protein/tetratricopeptide (TPR) repeat protein/TolB-like protein
MEARLAQEASLAESESSSGEVGLNRPRADGWRFDGFEFDARRGELRRVDGSPVLLRPKAEMLLRRFLEQPGRLISRDELTSELWAGRVVTDDSLVQCVGELRAALDDHLHRVIRTVRRRGYRFDVAVAPGVRARADLEAALPQEGLAAAAASDALPVGLDPRPTPFPPTEVTAMSTSARPRDRSLLTAVLVLLVVIAFCAAVVTRESVPASTRIDEDIAARHTIDVMPFTATEGAPALRYVADDVANQISAQIAAITGMRLGRAGLAPPVGATQGLAASRTNSTYSIVGRVTSTGAAETGATVDVQVLSVANGNLVAAEHFETGAFPGSTLGSDIAQQVVSLVRGRLLQIDAALAVRPGHPADAADLCLLGWNDLTQHNRQESIPRARARFEQALREDPESIIALTGLGAAYLSASFARTRLGSADMAKAEQVVEHAVRLAPNDATASLEWGAIQLLKGRADLALPAFEKANRLAPSFANGHLLLARAFLLLGRTEDVAIEAERAVRLALLSHDAPRVSDAYVVAAEAALMRGEDTRAYELAQRAAAELPSNVFAHAVLAAIDALRGRDQQAAAEMATYRRLMPKATVTSYDEYRPSTFPAFLAQRARLYEGLRKAGLPQG